MKFYDLTDLAHRNQEIIDALVAQMYAVLK